MSKLVSILTITYVLAFNLFAGNIILNLSNKEYPHISPLDDGFSVFALTENKMISKNYKVYGFMPYWKLNRAENVRVSSLTDIAYFALILEKDGTIRKRDASGNVDPGYNHWKNNENLDSLIQKTKQENVNFALTIISHEDDISDAFLDCRHCWDTAISEIIKELKYKGITDLNLDFEYVEKPDPDKKHKYTQFVELINKELDLEFGSSTVTVSTFADSSIRERVTDPTALSKVSDQLFIMAYDFHYRGSGRAGPVAPINRIAEYTSYDISTMLRDYLKFIPPNKLILGVPYYGYNWVVQAPEQYAVRLDGNDYIGYSQSQTYEEVMSSIIELKPEVDWDDTAKVPYFTYTSPTTGYSRVVYFENSESLKYKYSLVKAYQLSGVGIWALGYDGGYQELWNLLDIEFKN